jgi:hypothetical protein
MSFSKTTLSSQQNTGLGYGLFTVNSPFFDKLLRYLVWCRSAVSVIILSVVILSAIILVRWL